MKNYRQKSPVIIQIKVTVQKQQFLIFLASRKLMSIKRPSLTLLKLLSCSLMYETFKN